MVPRLPPYAQPEGSTGIKRGARRQTSATVATILVRPILPSHGVLSGAGRRKLHGTTGYGEVTAGRRETSRQFISPIMIGMMSMRTLQQSLGNAASEARSLEVPNPLTKRIGGPISVARRSETQIADRPGDASGAEEDGVRRFVAPPSGPAKASPVVLA
jgi:hypothetical protein